LIGNLVCELPEVLSDGVWVWFQPSPTGELALIGHEAVTSQILRSEGDLDPARDPP
jgi:hypothetical protein